VVKLVKKMLDKLLGIVYTNHSEDTQA